MHFHQGGCFLFQEKWDRRWELEILGQERQRIVLSAWRAFSVSSVMEMCDLIACGT